MQILEVILLHKVEYFFTKVESIELKSTCQNLQMADIGRMMEHASKSPVGHASFM